MNKPPLRIGDIATAKVVRKITDFRFFVDLKGYTLVCDSDTALNLGDEIQTQVLSIFPRVRIKILQEQTKP